MKPEIKVVKKWVKPYYRIVNGKKVYVRGHYISVAIGVLDEEEK